MFSIKNQKCKGSYQLNTYKDKVISHSQFSFLWFYWRYWPSVKDYRSAFKTITWPWSAHTQYFIKVLNFLLLLWLIQKERSRVALGWDYHDPEYLVIFLIIIDSKTKRIRISEHVIIKCISIDSKLVSLQWIFLLFEDITSFIEWFLILYLLVNVACSLPKPKGRKEFSNLVMT